MIIEDWMKHVWQYLGAALSAVLSLAVYKYKKKENRLDQIEEDAENNKVSILLLQEKITNLVDDVDEIKQDLKKVLFKLL